jgi:hypothetical protein
LLGRQDLGDRGPHRIHLGSERKQQLSHEGFRAGASRFHDSGYPIALFVGQLQLLERAGQHTPSRQSTALKPWLWSGRRGPNPLAGHAHERTDDECNGKHRHALKSQSRG